MTHSLTFTAISEARPGPKWKTRWDWSWPAYEAWFRNRGGDDGPSRQACEAALGRYLPELVPTYHALTRLGGGGDRAARFLSGWCPPAYLGGCSLAARSEKGRVRLVRNYDLSPDLNEGLLLRSEWTGRPVMGMIEFLWGLSDGINAAGLAVALAYGGRSTVGRGFGITTIVRYLLETCDDVATALTRLEAIPSHMAYNLVLTDRSGQVASVELSPGGGMRRIPDAIATNHQHGAAPAERAAFTRTAERRTYLEGMLVEGIAPHALRERFLNPPLYQRDYAGGFGTLFTADYDPVKGEMTLAWPSETWTQRLDTFREGCRAVRFEGSAGRSQTDCEPLHGTAKTATTVSGSFDDWLKQAIRGVPDWAAFGPSAARFFVPPTCRAHVEPPAFCDRGR